MIFDTLAQSFSQQPHMEISTMMASPCLRYKGNFVTMFFEKQDALIIKVSPERVNEIIEHGEGNEFNFTKKRFKEWVLIPSEFEERFEQYINEAMTYAKRNG